MTQTGTAPIFGGEPVDNDVRRVSVTKLVTYQGPSRWVEQCLKNSLRGTTCMSPSRQDRFVIVSTGEPLDETPYPNIRATQPDPKFLQSFDEEDSDGCRARLALALLRAWNNESRFDARVVMTINQWIDKGMRVPIPWLDSALFNEWAGEKGFVNWNGTISGGRNPNG